VIEGSPLKVAEVLTVSKLSSTRATSRNRTGLPSRVLTMMTRTRCVAQLAVGLQRQCLLRAVERADRVFELAALMAAVNSSRLMLRAAKAAGNTRTRTA